MARERPGNGMGTAWAWHAMCESAFNRSAATQDIPRLFCNPKIHNRDYNNQLHVPIPQPDQSSLRPHPISRTCILIMSFHLRLGLSHYKFSISCPISNAYVVLKVLSRPETFWKICNMPGFNGERSLVPSSTPKLEVKPLSAVRDCLFIFIISQNVAICPKTFSNNIDSHC